MSYTRKELEELEEILNKVHDYPVGKLKLMVSSEKNKDERMRLIQLAAIEELKQRENPIIKLTVDGDIVLFTPYKNKFTPNHDTLKLIDLELAMKIHTKWTRLIEEDGDPVNWLPSKNVILLLSLFTFQIEKVIFYHGGVPLYVLIFIVEGQEQYVRFVESFFTKVID